MLIKHVKKLPVQDRWLYWIKEREQIRLKKKANKPRPWTDDEILQSYRYCNVRRMDDKVSQWLLKNWYEPYYDHPNMLLACAMARHFNKPETLEYVGFPNKWRPQRVIDRARKLKQSQPVFNGAYIITGKYSTPDKVEGVVRCVLDPISRVSVFDLTTRSQTTQRCIEWLMGMTGIGSFMAGQIAADVRWATSGSFRDRKVWAAIGPGSRRGMNRFMGRYVEYPLRQEQFTSELTDAINLVKKKLPKIAKRLEAIDVQNTFCEMWKYERCLDGGRAKQKYQGV